MRIYADNAATTRTDERVVGKMLPFFTEIYGNPSSVHQAGLDARKAVAEARAQVAAAINCDPSEIYFTAGGSESDNWAIKETAKKLAKKGKHIISSKIEHHAVLHSLDALKKEGWEITLLDVDKGGFVNPADLEKAIRPDTVLVTVMTANNEIGSVQPVAELGRIAHEHGVLFHTDAVQAIGHIPVDVKAMNIDMLSMSAHKFNAPKGIGALYIRKGLVMPNLIDGGGQEKGKRAGTENTPGIVGMGEAITIACREMKENSEKLSYLRDKLINGLVQRIPCVKVNTPDHDSLPGIANISVRYIEGESMLLMMDLHGICASSGSACTSGSLDPSHVLLAIGLNAETAHGSIRFSLDKYNTEQEVDYILDTFPGIVQKLRDMSPLWHGQKD